MKALLTGQLPSRRCYGVCKWIGLACQLFFRGDAELEHVTWSQLKNLFLTRECGVKKLLEFGLELQHTSYITNEDFSSIPRAGQCVMAAYRFVQPVSVWLAWWTGKVETNTAYNRLRKVLNVIGLFSFLRHASRWRIPSVVLTVPYRLTCEWWCLVSLCAGIPASKQ